MTNAPSYDEMKFIQAVTEHTFKQSKFYKEVDDPYVTAIAEGVRKTGIRFSCAYIEEEVAGRESPLMAFYYLEEDDFWSLVGKGVHVYFPKPSFKLIPPKDPSEPPTPAWDEALIEALANFATSELITKLRSKRP